MPLGQARYRPARTDAEHFSSVLKATRQEEIDLSTKLACEYTLHWDLVITVQ